MVRSWKGRVGAIPPWVRIPSPLSYRWGKVFVPPVTLYSSRKLGAFGRLNYLKRFYLENCNEQSNLVGADGVIFSGNRLCERVLGVGNNQTM